MAILQEILTAVDDATGQDVLIVRTWSDACDFEASTYVLAPGVAPELVQVVVDEDRREALVYERWATWTGQPRKGGYRGPQA